MRDVPASYEQQQRARKRRAEAVRLRAAGIPYGEFAERLGYASESAARKDVARAEDVARREKLRADQERERVALAERERRLSIPEVREATRAERADESEWLAGLARAVSQMSERPAGVDASLVMVVVADRVLKRMDALNDRELAERDVLARLEDERALAAMLADLQPSAEDEALFAEMVAEGERAFAGFTAEAEAEEDARALPPRKVLQEVERFLGRGTGGRVVDLPRVSQREVARRVLREAGGRGGLAAGPVP